MAATDAGLRDSIVTPSGITTAVNALEILKSDHRQVERWFEQFERTHDSRAKQRIARHLCKALEVHSVIEEEIFYPAVLEATGDEDLHQESLEEHYATRSLIADIRSSPGPREDRQFDVRIKALQQLVTHQVNEKERPGGMFELAANCGLDLDALGERIEHRKIELMGDDSTNQGYDAAVQKPDEGEEIGTDFEEPDAAR